MPLVVRIRHDMKLTNPLLKDIRERYSLAYSMATTACVILNHKYHKIVKEDEIGYIALLFALALERKKTEIARKISFWYARREKAAPSCFSTATRQSSDHISTRSASVT